MNKTITTITMLIAILFTLLLATSCSDNSNFKYNDQTAGYDTQTYEIVEYDPYNVNTFEHQEEAWTEEDRQAAFLQQQQRREELDKYITKTQTWNRDEQKFEDEEQRIEEYCNEFGYLQCNTYKYTCLEEHKCHKVTLECEDAGFDHERLLRTQNKKYECNDWDVTIDEDDDFWMQDIDLVDFSGYGVVE